MRTLAKGLLLSCALLALTGCAMTGTWNMQSIQPETAKQHFNLQCMALNDDGTYIACVTEGTQHKCMSGTYAYDANTKTLTFKNGKDRAYKAELVAMGGEMKITGGEKDKEWTAVMKRGKCCPKGKCPMCGAACGPQCGKTCDPARCPGAKPAADKPGGKTAEPAKTEPKK